MKRNILFGIVLSSFSLSIFAQSSVIQKVISITPKISIQNFDWLERSTIGNIGVQLQCKPAKKLIFSFDGCVFKNLGNKSNPSIESELNIYDGNGNVIAEPLTRMFRPNQSINASDFKSSFQGAFINIDAGIPIKLGDSSQINVEPFVGIEGKIWHRTVDYGTDANPLIFEEKYKFLSPSLGAKLNYTSKSKLKLSVRISTSYPLISKLKTDAKNLSNANLETDLTKWLSPSMELGARIKKVNLKLRYEIINIGTTDSVKGTYPPSRANITGFSIGYDF